MTSRGPQNTLAVETDERFKLTAPTRQLPILRFPKILRPQDNTYATNGNNIVRFNFPAENMSFKHGFLILTATITKTGGTYARLSQGAHTMFYRSRLVIGAYEEECQYLNRLQTFLWNSRVQEDVQSSIGVDLLGFGTQFQRNGWGAGPKDYTIALKIGFLTNNEIIPFKKLLEGGRQQAFLELTLENPLAFIETDGTNPQLTISNLRFNYEQICSTDGSFEAKLAQVIESGNLKLGYDVWTVYQNALLNNTNDIQIQWTGNSLNTIANQIVDSSTQNNPLVNDKYSTWLKTLSNGATAFQYQHQINTNWIPQEAMLCSGDADRPFHHYLNYAGVYKEDGIMHFGAPISQGSFVTNQFLMICDVRSVPKEIGAQLIQKDTQFNNLSTSSASNTIFRFELSAAPPVNQVVYHLINSATLVCVSADGVLHKYV